MSQEVVIQSLSIFITSSIMSLFFVLMFLPMDKLMGVKITVMHILKEHQRLTLAFALSSMTNNIFTAILCFFISSFIVKKWYELVVK